MKQLLIYATSFLLTATLVSACGGGNQGGAGGAQPEEEGLSEEQLQNGIGPITSLELGDIDPALAAEGQAVFELKCSACHKTDKRYVGPALGDVLARRTPEFVMNMILNPEGMLAEHPEAKKLLAEYMTPMANQNLTEEEARAIVEYFRTLEGASEPASDDAM
jgi:mono/diheme cytochrome c family protein